MECVILVRMSNGKITALMDDEQYISIFPHMDDAVATADAHSLCKAFPYQIVECDEL